jgi:crotonobetainyl-CoA:carnitine CoA-transferase CaiB-like acyl-CoA transferase
VPVNPVRVVGVDAPATRTGAPAVGADTRGVLAAAGYSSDEVDALVAEGVVVE